MSDEKFVVVRSIDQQLGRWAKEAMTVYRVSKLPKRAWTKMLMGGRWFFEQGDPCGARKFVYRQVSKRWQYLHDDEVAEFISTNWGVQCIPHEDRIAA